MSWDPTLVAALITIVAFAFNVLLPLVGLNLDVVTVNSIATAIVLALLGIQVARGVKYLRTPPNVRSGASDHLDIF